MNSTHHFAMHEKKNWVFSNLFPENHFFVVLLQGEGGRSLVAEASWEGATKTNRACLASHEMK